MIGVLGDFNAKLSTWCWSHKSTYESSRTDGLVSNYGLQQLINEPTYKTGSSSFFIDLLSCSQPNLVMESGVHPSLHPNYHHQRIYAKFKLKVYYLPPYEREVWHYQNADSNAIKKQSQIFLGKRHLKTFLLMAKSLFLIKLLKPYSQIYSSWDNYNWWQKSTCFNKNAKSLIYEKSKAWRLYVRSNKNDLLLNLLHFKFN